MELDKDSAFQFAIMLGAGLPSNEAIQYFVEPDQDPRSIREMHDRWTRSKQVKEAIVELQGKPWQSMTLDEQIRTGIDKNYREMAYFLYSRNYVELAGPDKAKADTCRTALEAKLAGMAGKTDSLSRFFDDIQKGVVKLPALVPPQKSLAS